MDKLCGIYRIYNIKNDKLYVGSAVNLHQRRHAHFSLLKHNKHHSIYLQRAYNKYGEDSFFFEAIEFCEKEILIEREQYYIDTLNPDYNICRVAGNKLGVKSSKKSVNQRLKTIEEKCLNGFKYKAKPVYQYSLKGEFIKKWDNCGDAATNLNITKESLYFSIKHQSKCKNFLWSYFYLEKMNQRKNSVIKPIIQIDEEENIIQEWESIIKCAKDLKTSRIHIYNILNNKYKNVKYVLKYK